MSALLEALMGANRAEVDMNPWLNAARGAASADLSGYEMNPWTRALLQVGQGLGTGMMAGYGQKQVEEAQQSRAAQIADIMKSSTGKPLVDALQDVPGLKPYIGAIAIEQAASDAANRKELNKLLLEKRGMMLGEDNKPIRVFDPNASEIALAGGKRAAELKAEREAYGSSGLAPDKLSNLETDYTKTLTTGSEAKALLEVQTRAKQVMRALDTDDPLAATTAIYGYVKLIDPMGVVRGEDGRAVSQAGGPFAKAAQLINEIEGKGILTPEAKASMRALVPQLLQNQQDSYQSQVNAILGAAEKQGARRDRIGVIEPILFDQPANTETGPLSLADLLQEKARRDQGGLTPREKMKLGVGNLTNIQNRKNFDLVRELGGFDFGR
jgi:hypothetical protein